MSRSLQQSERKLEIFVGGCADIRAFVSPWSGYASPVTILSPLTLAGTWPSWFWSLTGTAVLVQHSRSAPLSWPFVLESCHACTSLLDRINTVPFGACCASCAQQPNRRDVSIENFDSEPTRTFHRLSFHRKNMLVNVSER